VPPVEQRSVNKSFQTEGERAPGTHGDKMKTKREQRRLAAVPAKSESHAVTSPSTHDCEGADGTLEVGRQPCKCAAYPWPHRRGGGNCNYPHPPSRRWKGKSGKHPGTFGRVGGGNSALRKRLLKQYCFHPIRDRDRIRRWLPKLYAAWSRRQGWPWVYEALGGWIPAMLVTERGVPKGIEPYNSHDLMSILLQGTSRKWECFTISPAQRRRTQNE
jgi:hypothetical protein